MADHEAGSFERPVISSAALAFSLAVHAACSALFVLSSRAEGGYREPAAVFHVLIGVSAVLAVGMNLVRRTVYFRALLVPRTVLLLLVCAPFSRDVTIRLLLLMVLFLDIAVAEAFPVNILIASAALMANIAAAAAGMDRAVAPALRAHDLAVLAVVGGTAAVLSCFMTWYREKMAAYGREVEKMSLAAEESVRAQMGYLEYAKSAEQRSTQSERNRLSSELHDSLGYTFTNLKMIIEAAKDLLAVDPGRLRELLQSAAEQVEHGMAETRKALYIIRETREAPPPFFASLHRMVQVFHKATRVEVAIDYANFPTEVDVKVESAFYHFIQEGLVNSFSHGRASSIRVLLWADAEKLQAVVEDNGIGATAIQEGIGIRGMRERLGSLGGTLNLQNAPGGFKMIAQIPFREEPWDV